MHEGPNGKGLSRKAILHEVEQCLKRLGTDYIDFIFIAGIIILQLKKRCVL